MKNKYILFLSYILAAGLLAGCNCETCSYQTETSDRVMQAKLNKQAGSTILYPFDSAELTREACKNLDDLSSWLKSNQEVSITIEGHCDERGTREYNLALGEKRANTVKQYLICQRGIDPSRIDTISYGKERPQFVGHGESIWSKNRRSVAVVK